MDEEYRSLMVNDTWDLVHLPQVRKLVRCKWVYRTKYASDGSVERLKERLVFPKLKGLNRMKPLLLSQNWISSALFFPLQPYIIGNSIKWMSIIPSYMVIYKRKFTWNNLLYMFKITLALSVSLRNPYMALSKLLELSMPKWISFYLTLVFIEVIMTPMSILRK